MRGWLCCLGVFALGCVSDEEGIDGNGDVVDPDRVDPACHGAPLAPVTCAPSLAREHPSAGAGHIAWPTPIHYIETPPSSGDHRPEWGRWGEYSFLPPQRWLHNLEHGGVALLYDPCLDAALVEALRAFARARPDDDGGPFRWVLTPYPGLPAPVMAVAWQWTWLAQCLSDERLAELESFVTDHYRQSPEDFDGDGSFSDGWLGK